MKPFLFLCLFFLMSINSIVAASAKNSANTKPKIKINATQMTCSLYQSKIESLLGTPLESNAVFLRMWLYGYTSSIKKNNFYSLEQYKQLFIKLEEQCSANLNKNIIEILTKTWSINQLTAVSKNELDNPKIDVVNMSCQEYMLKIKYFMDKNLKYNAAFLMMWIYGYSSETQENNYYGVSQYKKIFSELGGQCANNPTKKLIKAVLDSWSI